ncbi:hypothetical protein MMC12_001978 [Toensbergia leucococca]|nr:hypothetical protein [Toensbergia leucococca]
MLPSRDNTASPPPPYDRVSPQPRSPSPNLLASMRNLVPMPLRRSRSPSRPPREDEELRPRDASLLTVPDSHTSHRLEISQPQPISPNFSLPRRGSHDPERSRERHREQIPSMIDYLTLEQLENVWRKQDTYKGCVEIPQKTKRQNRRSGEYQAPHAVHRPSLRDQHYRSHEDLERYRRGVAPPSRWI